MGRGEGAEHPTGRDQAVGVEVLGREDEDLVPSQRRPQLALEVGRCRGSTGGGRRPPGPAKVPDSGVRVGASAVVGIVDDAITLNLTDQVIFWFPES